MARGSLSLLSSEDAVSDMKVRLTKERDMVAEIVKREVEKLMRFGAETSGMTYICPSSNTNRTCLQPKHMRISYVQNDEGVNIKRIHWIFHELPDTLHRDVLMHRMSHMNVVTEMVMHELNVVWGDMRDGEEAKRSNCIEKIYTRVINEKKTTIIKRERTKHERTLFIRHPQTRAQSGNPGAYRQGQTEFYWKSVQEGVQVVRSARV
jgi:hypothetical protein